MSPRSHTGDALRKRRLSSPLVRRRFVRLAIRFALALSATACASTGATVGSGVGDRFLERPPYYAGAPIVPDVERIAHLPITFQRGAVQADFFEPEATEGTRVAALLAEMNARLDALMSDRPLTLPATSGAVPPDVRFGCEYTTLDDCESSSGGASGRMLLAVGRPSGQWTAAAADALTRAGRDHLLVITLEIGQYRPRQKNWRGSKEVLLGTGYAEGLPWLTGLDQPVQVLQLTGALMDAQGRAVRIGAEGLLAKRTHVVLGGFGIQALISEEDVAKLQGRRREDLHDQPLVWEVALQNLVAQLTGRPGIR